MNRVTLEEARGRVLYVRCHKTDQIPGEYVRAFAIEETAPGIWEAKIAEESMDMPQRRDFQKAVMEFGDIDKIIWTHFIGGVPRQRETKFRSTGQ